MLGDPSRPKIIQIESKDGEVKRVLTSRAAAVELPLSPEDVATVGALEETLQLLGGVGLAATQIGVSRRLASVYIPETATARRPEAEPHPMHTIVNPEYIGVEEDMVEPGFEGCYSVGSKSGMVSRFRSIRVTYRTPRGEPVDRVVSGFYARVLQHEIDHLNGVLITDRLSPENIVSNRPNPAPAHMLAS
jgi:peptide deformylase